MSNEGRNEKILALWAQGLSAAKIAARLGGGLTRCAVIGVVHRSKAKTRPTVVRFDVHNKAPAELRMTRKPKPPPPPPEAPPSLNLSIEALSDAVCRFPTSGDRAPYSYCGYPVDEGSPYCIFHRRLCCVPMPPPKSKQEKAA